MKKSLLLLTLTAGLMACGQDPYGGKTPPNGPPKEIVLQPKPLPGANALLVDDVLEFVEGRHDEHFLRGTVEGNGTPVLQFDSLPPGVTYNPVTERLIWKPGYKAGNDPHRPDKLFNNYVIRVLLFSSENPAVERASQRVILSVMDAPLPAGLKSPLDMKGKEGQTLIHKIDFEDLEFPTGPFEMAHSGLPADVEVIWPDRKVPSFTLKWTPGYDKIIGKSVDTYNGSIVLYNPRGKRLDFSVFWEITNVNVPPITAGPNSVAQPGDMDFIVIAEDVNAEEVPEWKAVKPPAYGFFNITTTAMSGPGRPKSTGVISWKGVPKDKLDLPVDVELEACVKGWVCSPFKVTLQPMSVRPAPQGAQR